MRRPHPLLGIVCIALAGAACTDGRAQGEGTSLAGALASIHAEDMAARIGLLAADSMQGRDTPSRELEQTARYIAAEFRRFGLEPGSPAGEYIQRYPISIRRVEGGAQIQILGPSGNVSLEAGAHFALYPRGGLPDTLAHPVWFAGREAGRAGDDAPVGAFWIVPVASLSVGSSVFVPWVEAASDAGAAAVAFVLPDEAGRFLQALAQGGAVVGLDSARVDATPIVLVTEQGVERLFSRHRKHEPTLSGEGGEPRALGVRARVRAPAQVEITTAPNVIGILRGGDPRLRDEYVLLTAHMDHVGVGAPVNGDSIYNGADDDASGTASVIEIAEAMSRVVPRPRRSMIFVTVSGEEKGLLGSQWFSEHPTVPLARIVADLNIDMVGRNWRDTIVAVGKGQSSLGATVDSVARANPRLGLAVVDDLWPQERFFFRSDHYNFARKGVPILFFFNGVHEDYHRPSDEPHKIDAEKAARVARLILLTGWAVANADERPRWDPAARAEVVESL